MSKILTIDCDEVLADTCCAALAFSGGKFNQKTLERHEITNFLRHKIPWYEADGEVFDQYWKNFFTNYEQVISIPVVPWAQKAIPSLRQLWYRLVVVTWRWNNSKDATHYRLQKHFPGTFDEVIFAHHGNEYHIGKNKAELMESLWSEILIDDGLHNCENIAQAGMKAFLLDNPWNQKDELHHNITRVKGRDEILTYFQKL